MLASRHEGIGVMVIKTKLVHPPENAFAVSAVARGHTLAYTMQKQRKDLIFIFVKEPSFWVMSVTVLMDAEQKLGQRQH